MANPWEKYGQSSPAPQAPATPPPFIGGVTTPRQASAEARANEDQAMQREANARAAAAADRQAAAAERAAAAADRTAIKDAKGTESERTAGFLAGRIVDGIGRMSTSVQADSSAASPTMGVEAVRGVFGDTAANYMTDPQRQQVRAAQMDILDAALTLGTGAAYTKEQLEGYRTSYFPQLGDDASTVASKQQALRSLIVNAQTKAGSASPDIEKALAALDAMSGVSQPNAKQEWTKEQSAAEWGPGVLDDQGNPLGPDGGEGFDAQGKSLGMFGRVTDDSPDAQIEKINAMEGDPSGLSGIAALAKQGVTLGLSDEAAGIGGAIGAFLTGQDPNAAYDLNNRAADVYLDRARQANPWIGGGAEFLGGGGAARVASMAPTIGNAMRTGAGIGATGGFGYGEGAGGSTVNALLGAAGGAAIGGGAQYGLNALASRAARAPSGVAPDMDVIAAGQRQGIPIRQPDARPELRGDLAKAEASSYGGAKVARTLADDKAAVQAKVSEVGGPGNVHSEDYNLGQQVQGVGKRYIPDTRTIKNAKYNKADQLSGGQRINPANAIAAVDRNIAELEATGSNMNGKTIEYLRGLREDLSKPGGFSITEFQGLRSGSANKIKGDEALTVSDADRRLTDVNKAFTSDAEAQLPKDSFSALQKADAYYAQRQDFINNVLKNVMGTKGKPLPPERAAERFRAMVGNKADLDKLTRYMKEATPEEAADFAATIAEGLGRGRNGEFGLGALATNIEKVPPNIRKLMFGDDGAKALEDLQVIARAKSDTAGGLNNSRSGVVVARQIGLRALLGATLGASGGGVTGAVAVPAITEVITAIGQQRAARLLLNPNFTKWLRNAPNTTNPQAIDRYFGKLAGMTGVAANDNAAFVNALRAAFSKSPTAGVAAKEEDKDVGRKPVGN